MSCPEMKKQKTKPRPEVLFFLEDPIFSPPQRNALSGTEQAV